MFVPNPACVGVDESVCAYVCVERERLLTHLFAAVTSFKTQPRDNQCEMKLQTALRAVDRLSVHLL